ncbi:hypothetical protein HZS_3034 [Henneguya salminicola]|nr:hypothetical protein HZS_3034 [Henneguya salminicola]
MLKRLVRAFEQNPTCQIDSIIYLRDSPQNCLERMKIRDPDEKRIGLEKLVALHYLLEETFIENVCFVPCSVFVIDIVDGIEAMSKVYDQKIPKLLKHKI